MGRLTMNTQSNQGHYFSRLRDDFLQKFFEHYIPKRYKRAIVMSSLLGFIGKVEDPDKELLNKINTAWSLCKDDGTLFIPIRKTNWIWRNLPNEINEVTSTHGNVKDFHELTYKKVTYAQARAISGFILKYLPNWLVYDSKRKMKRDITDIIKKSSMVFA